MDVEANLETNSELNFGAIDIPKTDQEKLYHI